LKEAWDSAIEEVAEAVPFTAEERIENFAYDFRPYIKKFKKAAAAAKKEVRCL